MTRALQLTRPLVCLDTETTGTMPQIDRVIQVGLVKRYPDGRETRYKTLINPGEPIPPESIEVHHITDEMVRNAPKFAEVAHDLASGLKGCDLAGYNVLFDVRMLDMEFRRLQGMRNVFRDAHMVDGNRIYHERFRRNLEAAVREYLGEDAAKEFATGAHDAAWDAEWSLRVIDAQVVRHEDLPVTLPELDQLYFWTARGQRVDAEGRWIWRFGHPVFAFGKHLGTPLRDVPKDYLRWMQGQEFSDDCKEIVVNALAGRYPVREVKDAAIHLPSGEQKEG